MKNKILAVILVVVMSLSLAACGGRASGEDYIGTWIAEPWTNEKTGISSDIVLELYDDNTFVREATMSDGGFEKVQGEWEVDKSEIILTIHEVIEGDVPGYGEDGKVKDGCSEMKSKWTIENSTTLKGGARVLHKEQ